jgi:hypothetical protein
MRRFLTGFLAVVSGGGFAAALACASGGGPTVVEPVTVSKDWVTGAAAAALGPDGRFVLPGPSNPGPLEISEASARAQAVAWARLVSRIPTTGGTESFAPGGSGLEQEYGGKIAFARLRDCGRAIYAESAYGPVADGLPRYLLNGFGSYWVIDLCSPVGDVPVVLAVAATSALVVSGGELQPNPPPSGNEFRSAAVLRGTPLARVYPLAPEAVVAFAYRQTRRRVSEVPVFVQRVADYGRPDPIYPQNGHWLVTLEAPVQGVGVVSGAQYDTREVAVFWPGSARTDTTLSVALAGQPKAALRVPYKVYTETAGGVEVRQDTVSVAVRTPYLFEVLRLSPR